MQVNSDNTPDTRSDRAVPAGRQRRRWPAALLALLLALPGAAWPMSLARLLQFPLDVLLRLEITPSRVAPQLPARRVPAGVRAPAAGDAS